ncbi:MarR family transcriptional regulator [Desulfovibrio sp. JC010]|uniref:MarR family transcriptional regulator n=1 Tax=Desulfovibrio sp. JC010 TaxID=2593641 RepID=UPI001EF3B16F|nr:MarR family transcriptional regulator [Desulfovibrio sp. JC010]
MDNKEEAIRYMAGRLIRIINKHSRIEEQPIVIGEGLELTPREIRCLHAIGLNEGANLKTIAEVLGVTKSAISQMMGKLEKRGFVRKESAPDNRKELLAMLTERGREAFDVHQEFHERHMNNLKERLDEFTDPQLATAGAVLAVVETVVDDRLAEMFGKKV